MMANQLTPTIETYVALNTLDIGLHGVGQATIASEKVHFNNWYSKWQYNLYLILPRTTKQSRQAVVVSP